MAGRKRLRKQIYETDFVEIERRADLLERALNQASIGMDPYTPHGEAMMKLRKDLRAAINVLGNRPANYLRPNCHMSPEQLAWHDEVERTARESLPGAGEDDLE